MIKWKEVSIDDSGLKLADGNYSAKYPRQEDFIFEGIPFIRANNFSNNTITDDKLRFISEVKHQQLKKGHLEANDVLIITRGNIGEVALVPERHENSNINAQIVLLRSNVEWCPKYLLYLMSSFYVKNQLPNLITGSALKQLSITNLKRLNLVKPPLKTQQKIAAILDEADRLRQLDKKLLQQYEALSQSLFLEMFGDPVVNPKGWETVKFSAVGKLDRGKSKHRPRNAPKLLGGPYPLIQTGDVANSNGYIKKYKSTYSEIGLSQSKMWPKGTLCITIAANIAKTGILTFDACFPDSVVGFVPNNETVNEYVQIWISFLQKILEEKAPAVAQKNINLSILRNIEFMKPPKELQVTFSSYVQEIEKQKTQAQESLTKSEELFNSLLQKAFKGELV